MKIYLKTNIGSTKQEFEVCPESDIAFYADNPNYQFYKVQAMKEVKAKIEIIDVL